MERSGSPIDKGGNLARRERGLAIYQNHVAADAERGSGTGNGDGLVCGSCVRHERCAGQNAAGMQLGNGSVDSRCQAKIVGVYNETAHGLSLSIEGVGLPQIEGTGIMTTGRDPSAAPVGG